MSDEGETGELAPLKVTCTMANCEGDLHCFKFHSRKMKDGDRGNCRYCGVSFVDWDRVQTRDVLDIEHTVEALQREFIRHHFWHVEIDQKADEHARRKGRAALRSAARTRVTNSVGAAEPSRDGQQTPFSGNVLYYAQHATACCCRSCIAYWHGIPQGQALDETQIEYFSNLLMTYVEQRMPHLPNEPEKIPRRHRGSGTA
jgi:hypothetical protein